jgi:hypothetical protein
MSVSVLDPQGTPRTVVVSACALLRTLFDLAVIEQPTGLTEHLALSLVPSTDSRSPASMSAGRVDSSKLDSVTVREMSELLPAHFVYKLAFVTSFSCLCLSQSVILLFDMQTTLAQLKHRYLLLWWSREGREASTQQPERRVAVYLSPADRDAGREIAARDNEPFADLWLTSGCMATAFFVRVIRSAKPSSGEDALQMSSAAAAAVPPAEQSSPLYQLTIRTLTGKSFAVSVLPTYSVAVVKMKIRDLESIPVDQQRLVFGGRQLQDACTLEQCGVSNESMVHLVLKLC